MKIYDLDGYFLNKCKIGISSDPVYRAKTLNTAWDGIVEFRIHKVSDMSSKGALFMEQDIHSVLKRMELQYVSKVELDGYTEIFEYSTWMDNLVSEYKKKTK